jgi:hypothetical protein
MQTKKGIEIIRHMMPRRPSSGQVSRSVIDEGFACIFFSGGLRVGDSLWLGASAVRVFDQRWLESIKP